MHSSLLIRTCGVESDASIEFLENLVVNVWPRSTYLDQREIDITMSAGTTELCLFLLVKSPDPFIHQVATYIAAKRGPNGVKVTLKGAYVDPIMTALQRGLRDHLLEARQAVNH